MHPQRVGWLHWHLSGPQSSHMNNAVFYYLPTSLFHFFSFFWRRAFFFLFFCRPFFHVYSYIRVCCRRASTANTARQGAISPTQSSKASTCRSERDNASEQIELARASLKSSIYTARCVERRYRHLHGLPKYTSTHQAAWLE